MSAYAAESTIAMCDAQEPHQVSSLRCLTNAELEEVNGGLVNPILLQNFALGFAIGYFWPW